MNQMFRYDTLMDWKDIKKRGGGVGIYLKSHLVYRVRDDLSTSDDDREILTLELTPSVGRHLLISCAYLPPQGITLNFSEFSTLEKVWIYKASIQKSCLLYSL